MEQFGQRPISFLFQTCYPQLQLMLAHQPLANLTDCCLVIEEQHAVSFESFFTKQRPAAAENNNDKRDESENT